MDVNEFLPALTVDWLVRLLEKYPNCAAENFCVFRIIALKGVLNVGARMTFLRVFAVFLCDFKRRRRRSRRRRRMRRRRWRRIRRRRRRRKRRRRRIRRRRRRPERRQEYGLCWEKHIACLRVSWKSVKLKHHSASGLKWISHRVVHICFPIFVKFATKRCARAVQYLRFS